MLKKIVVTGPESTGKSTLSEALADTLHTIWVPEFARGYLEQLDRPYTEADLLKIAQGQLRLEDELAGNANGFLICDTDLHVVRIWSEHSFGRCDPWILEQIAIRRYDLYLLNYIDTPWEQDPLREHPEEEMRNYFYAQYHDAVTDSGTPWAEMRGGLTERIQQALAATAKII